MIDYILITYVVYPVCSWHWQSFWEALGALGTISAGYFAYRAIKESNRQRELEQKPQLLVGNMNYPKADGINIRNIGRGQAQNIRITSDIAGKKSLLDEHVPLSTSLVSGESVSLMLDGVKVRNIIGNEKYLISFLMWDAA